MTRSMALAASVVLAAVLATCAAGAQGGALDTTFGGDGTVSVDVAPRESIWSVAVQPDGKVVAGGSAADGTGRSSSGVLLRLNVDGTADATFDGDGRVESSLVGYMGAVALQRDGRIVFAGGNMRLDGTGTEFAVARYNADGSLDGSFGSGGRLTTDFQPGTDMARAVLVQPDGRLLVAGQTIVGGNSNLALARYLPDGRLDASFGGGGTVVTDIGGWDVASELAVAPDGRILLSILESAGSTSTESTVGVVRYTSGGTLDTSFDGDGVLVTGRRVSNTVGLALQRDGRIVVSGGRGLAALRFTADGRPDRTFGGDGVAEALIEGFAQSADVVLQANGKIAVVGTLDAPGAPTLDLIAARFLPNGRVDAAFAGAAGDAGGNEWPFAAALAPDGRIVGAGMTMREGTYDTDGTLARYLPGTCSVPALRGLTLVSARARLAAANCRLGKVRPAASKTVAKGRIVRQSLPARREAPDWALVDVVVSRK